MNKHLRLQLCTTLVAVLSFAQFTYSQTASSNYVKVYKALKPIAGDLSIYESKDCVAVSIVYYDGLGRETQSIARQQSPLGKDLVSFSVYDDYGMKTKSYLPYTADQTTGGLVVDPKIDQKNFYISLFGSVNGNAALSETVIERSELSRVVEQGAPGYDWRVGSGHTITKQYLTNVNADSIYQFIYSGGGIAVGSFYPETSLNCSTTVDEHGNDVKEFLDKEGRTVCKKVRASTVAYAYTYYVYDVFGNLVVVIPPEGVKQILTTNGN